MAVGYGTGGTWSDMGSYGLLSSEDAVETGLGGALNLIQNANRINYPAYVASQKQAPSQQSYYSYTANAPMGKVSTPNYQYTAGNAPTYQGLMGGDYNRLESALAAPGQIAAQNAYTTASRDLTNAMGGRGLYGSSIMGTQANEGLNREYMNALATNAANAAASRYGMQASDLANKNQFGTTVYGQKLGQEEAANQYGLNQAGQQMTQEQNLYNAGVSDASRQGDYAKAAMEYANTGNEAYREWANAQNLEKYQYDLAAAQYANQQNTALINQYLALAGYGAPLSSSSNSSNISSWLSALGTYLGNYGS